MVTKIALLVSKCCAAKARGTDCCASAERRRSTAGGRLKSARERAVLLHLKEPSCDDFLGHRACQLQWLVLQPYSDALAQRARIPDSTMPFTGLHFKRAHYE
jgi:hypothetical protein